MSGATEDDFAWVVFSGMRPDKPACVSRVREFVGPGLFRRLRWHVAAGEAKSYTQAGALNATSSGTTSDAVNAAFRLADAMKKPVVLMADDVVRISNCGAPAQLWTSEHGVTMRPLAAAIALKQLCDKFCSKVAGAYPMANTFYQLRCSPLSFASFVVADFFLVMPGVGVRWSDAWRPKEDVDFTLKVLQRHGLIVRSNYLSVTAQHHKPGGDGDGHKRFQKDVKIRKMLMKSWNSAKSVHPVRPGRNESEVKIHGLELVKREHPDMFGVLKAAEATFKSVSALSHDQAIRLREQLK